MRTENHSSSLRVLFYALGGGLGHMMRSLAVARQLARAGASTRILFNSPFSLAAQQLVEAESGRGQRPELVPISPTATAAEVAVRIQIEAASFAPQLLIVDTFPRGLGGELADWLPCLTGIKKVLISRCLPERYLREMQLQSFVDRFYDLVVWPGERGAIRPAETTRLAEIPYPLLVRDSEELPSRSEAAKRLEVDPTRPTILWVGCGTAEECRESAVVSKEFSKTATREMNSDFLQVRLLMPRDSGCESQHSNRCSVGGPLIECLPAVDFVVGSAGYNLYWEIRSMNIPSYLIARRRVYDNQFQRQTENHFGLDASHIWQRFHEQIEIVVNQTKRSSASYVNGAKMAADAVVAAV